MSFRREPRTVPERLAALEEQLRKTTQAVVVNGSGVGPGGLPAGLLNAKGDLIVGIGPDIAGRLPAGDDGLVLTANSSADLGVDWAPLPVDTSGAAQMLVYLMDEG